LENLIYKANQIIFHVPIKKNLKKFKKI
jgi:hypothetical protein